MKTWLNFLEPLPSEKIAYLYMGFAGQADLLPGGFGGLDCFLDPRIFWYTGNAYSSLNPCRIFICDLFRND